MSIFNEYQEIKKYFGQTEFEQIEKFLELHPEYYLSDVYYSQMVYNEFEKWKEGKDNAK